MLTNKIANPEQDLPAEALETISDCVLARHFLLANSKAWDASRTKLSKYAALARQILDISTLLPPPQQHSKSGDYRKFVKDDGHTSLL